MTREVTQTPVPRICGYTVYVVAESCAQQGEAETAERLAMSTSQVRRAVKMWEEWKIKGILSTKPALEVQGRCT